MDVALWIVGIVAALWALDRLSLWAEAKGWIYYRKTKKRRGGMGDAFMDVSSIINPSASYVREAHEARKKVERRESGDDPPELHG